MDFIVRETGERYRISSVKENGYDYAEILAAQYGVLQNCIRRRLVVQDEEQHAYVASGDLVKYWRKFFASYGDAAREIAALKREYGSERVEEVLAFFRQELDLESYRGAVRNTIREFHMRYNTDTARFVGDYVFNQYGNDSAYFKESLYQRPDGTYFMVREGKWESLYSYESEKSHGKHTYNVSKAKAERWIGKRCDMEGFSIP